MTKTSRLTILAFTTCLFAAPAGASVTVIGNSLGVSCYEAARARNYSQESLNFCDQAFASGMLSARDEVATYVNRGVIKLVGGRFDEAIADFDRATALDPTEPEAYLNKGSALLRKNADARQAITLFDQALQRKTKRPEIAYYARAAAYEETGDVRAAYLDYQRAQQAAPRWDLPARELSRFSIRRAGGSSL